MAHISKNLFFKRWCIPIYWSILQVTSSLLLSSCTEANKSDTKKAPQVFPVNVVALINKVPVHIKEFKIVLTDQRANVASYFNNKYGAEYHSNFWNTEYGAEIPGKMAKERAMDVILSRKVQQIEMARRGFGPSLDYEKFLDELKTTNQQRTKMVNDGGVVYGPKNYTPRVYFTYLLSNGQNRLKREMSGKQLPFDELVLRKEYERLKHTYFKTTRGQVEDKTHDSELSFESFEDVRDRVISLYVNRAYLQWIEHQKKDAEVLINYAIYDSISLK